MSSLPAIDQADGPAATGRSGRAEAAAAAASASRYSLTAASAAAIFFVREAIEKTVSPVSSCRNEIYKVQLRFFLTPRSDRLQGP